jgi:diacylglycerol kinase (ATP)
MREPTRTPDCRSDAEQKAGAPIGVRLPGVEDEPPLDPDLIEPPEWTTRAGRRSFREKLAAGLRGLKHAMRGDSSFFAHAYRGLLVTLCAALLGVAPMAWCLLVMSTALVLVAELAHSAIDTLARSLGDPEELGLKVAREIATAGVLVAVIVMAATSVTVIVFRLAELFSWW